MISFTESELEAAPLEWLSGLGWAVAHGPEIGPGAPAAEALSSGLAL